MRSSTFLSSLNGSWRSRRASAAVVAVGLVVGLLLSSPVLAQGIPTATLSGRVSNDSLGLPGVTVTAKSPNLQGTRVTSTGANGDYVFANVPPGEYTITFALQGFQTQTKSITLAASQTSRLDANIAVAAVSASETVSGKAESVSQSTMAATTYTSTLLSELPTARTITSAVLLSPGVVTGVNGPQIAGAQSVENLYTVNGVVIVDNVRTSPNNLFIEDAVQETTTMTSGVSAEYGRFSGGVVNTITKSGGNNYSGSLRATISNDAWRSTSAYRTAAGVNPQEGTFLQKLLPTYEATFGGPIFRDMLWVFAAGRYQDRTTSSLTTYTNIPYAPQTTEKRYEGKLTFSPFQNQTLTGSFIGIDTKQNNYTQFTTFDLESLSNRQLPQSLLALNYNGVLTDSFFVEGQYSRRKFSFENSGSPFSDPLQGTPVVDLVLGPQMNSAYYCGHCPAKERNNDNYVVKGTYFLSTKSLGSHNIVGGYDDFGGQRHEDNYQSGSNWIIYTSAASIIKDGVAYPVIDPNGEVDFWPIFGSGTSDIRTRSFYVNDTWRFSDRLSLNLGVRYDKNHAVDPLGVVTSNDSAFSPRLAAIVDPTGKGTLRVTASYAKYVTALQDTQATGASAAGNPADFWWYFDKPGAPSINTDPTKPLVSARDAVGQVFTWLTSLGCYPNPLASTCTMPIDAGRYSGVSTQLRDSLASPYAQEFAIGVSGNIGAKATFRTDVVRREYKNFYDLRRDLSTGRVTDPVGNTYDLGLIEISNDYRREYTGLHTQFAYRVNARLNVGGNWTWSHLLGNAVGETSGSGTVQLTDHSYPEYFDRSWKNPTGSLSSDQRHRVLLYGSYDVPIPKNLGSLTIGLVQRWDTGTPYGAFGTIDTRPFVKNPGYYNTTAAGNSTTYYYTARDAFRTEDVYNTDLSMNFSYKIANAVEVFISPQVYNVFNAQHVITPNTTVLNPKSSSGFTTFNPFTTAPVQGAKGTGANWNYGPSFGQAVSASGYQTPRYFQVAVGLRF